jgi:hypothetical protein
MRRRLIAIGVVIVVMGIRHGYSAQILSVASG